ncbi:MAG: Oxygen-dependent protoporphyrinogen oxidase [Rhizobium sp.]|nr:Oxygen-dependent protoporphyrinogen oxidase [Rhizobium sp.]
MRQPVARARKVAVIGGGIAGLTAAWHLRRAGFDVTVIEAADRLGGRVGEAEKDGIRYNTGARLFYPFSKPFNQMLVDLGLSGELVPIRGLGARVDGAKESWRIELMPGIRTLMDPALDWSDRARFVRYGLRMLASLPKADPDDAASVPSAGDETLADHIRRHLGAKVLERLVRPVFRGTRSQDADQISASFFATTTPHMLGRKTVHVLARGMNALPEALARDLTLLTGTRVERVEPLEGGHLVVARNAGDEILIRADLVVSALEGDRVNDIFAGLDKTDRAFFSQVRYNALGVVHHRLNRDLAPDMRFFAEDAGGSISTYQQLPGNPAKGIAAQLYVQLSPEAVLRTAETGSQERMHEIVAPDLKRLYPSLDQDSVMYLNQWISRKLPVFYPGYTRSVADFLGRQARNRSGLFFCGDYLSQPLVTGAAASGARAATQIIRGQ